MDQRHNDTGSGSYRISISAGRLTSPTHAVAEKPTSRLDLYILPLSAKRPAQYTRGYEITDNLYYWNTGHCLSNDPELFASLTGVRPRGIGCFTSDLCTSRYTLVYV